MLRPRKKFGSDRYDILRSTVKVYSLYLIYCPPCDPSNARWKDRVIHSKAHYVSKERFEGGGGGGPFLKALDGGGGGGPFFNVVAPPLPWEVAGETERAP